MSGPLFLLFLFVVVVGLVKFPPPIATWFASTPAPSNPVAAGAGLPAPARARMSLGMRIAITVAVVAVIALAIWGVTSMHGTLSDFLKAPSAKTLWEVTKNYWLWILILAGGLWLLTMLAPVEYRSTLKALIGLTLVLLFIGAPILVAIDENSSPDCVKGHPCALSENEDGSSEVVAMPLGKVLCLTPGAEARLNELGFRAWYEAAGEQEKPFACSTKAVVDKSCTTLYDHFVFRPTNKNRLPNYWFVPVGSKQC